MQFDVKPFHIDLVLEKHSVARCANGPFTDPQIIECREPTKEERDELYRSWTDWLTSIGHACNPSCSPPFSHTSQAAHDEIEMYLNHRRS